MSIDPIISRSISSRLEATVSLKVVKPVILPVGRDMLLVRPSAIGSPVTAETIGMIEVASRRARAVVDVVERMASGPSVTNSAAEARTRSPSSATRVAIRSLASVQPSSCSRFLNVTRLGSVSAKVARTPMARTRSVVCARAIAGQTAALPNNVMNSRRLIVALKKHRKGPRSHLN